MTVVSIPSIRKYFILHRENIIAVVLFFVLSAYLTSPLISNLSTHLHWIGDPEFVSWSIWHAQEKLLSFDLLTYYETKIFFPFKSNVAYSDLHFTLGLLALPLRIFVSDPVLQYNILVFCAYWLSAYSTYLLAKYYTKELLPSLIAGVIYGFSPFMMAQFGHLQVTSCYLLPLIVLYLEKYVETGQRKNSIMFTCLLVAQFWLALYNFLFILIFVICLLLYRVRKFRGDRFLKLGIDLLICATIFIVFCFIVLYKYYALSTNYSFYRTLSDAVAGSADVGDYLQPGNNKFWGGNLFPPIDMEHFSMEHFLFPGGVAILLFFIGIYVYYSKKIGLEYKSNLTLYYIFFAASFIFSLGPILQVRGEVLFFDHHYPIVLPYAFIYKLVPLLKGIRVPARADSVVILSMAIIAALVLNYLTSKWVKIYRLSTHLLLLAFLTVELKGYGIGMVPYKTHLASKNFWIRDNTPTNSLILEYAEAVSPQREFEAASILATTIHKRSTINGYSGFFPPEFMRMRKDLTEQEAVDMLSIIKSMNPQTYIVWNKSYPDSLFTKYKNHLVEEYKDSSHVIYTIPNNIVTATLSKKNRPITQFHGDKMVVIYSNNSTENKYFQEDFDTILLKYKDGKVQKFIVPTPLYQIKRSCIFNEIAISHDNHDIKEVFVNDSFYTSTISREPIVNSNVTFISSQAEIVVAKAGQSCSIDFILQNNTGQTLSSVGRDPVNIANKWFDESGKPIEGYDSRRPLFKELKDKNSVPIYLSFKVPPTKGRYKLLVTLVQENVKWFHDGQPTATLNKIVIVE